jgi:hypothetical protein
MSQEEREKMLRTKNMERTRDGRGRPQAQAAEVSVGVSIAFPLLVVGALMLGLLIISKVGGTTFLFALAGVLVVAGVLAATSRRIF